ncbi:MAG TPA: DMT family transporter [Thermomicrobiales bacterium]|nr:DMT family transporter [Thermomicrobiales bacterium]
MIRTDPTTPRASQQPAEQAVELRHLAWLLMLGLMWGSAYLFVKVLVDVASPSAMIAVRFALGVGTLGVVLLARGGRLPRFGIMWLHLLVMAVISNAVPFMLIAWSQQYATSAIAAVLNATTPFFTLLFAVIVFSIDRFTRERVIGIALGFAGVALLTGNSLVNVRDDASLGELALLGSSACYGFGYAYARRFVRGEPLQNVTFQLLLGFLITAPLALYGGWVRPANLTILNAAAWIILGVAGTGLSYILFYRLIGGIGATRTSLVTYITPVVGVVLGWLVLGEYLGVSGLAGMLLIVGGIAISYGWARRLRRGRQAPRVVAGS